MRSGQIIEDRDGNSVTQKEGMERIELRKGLIGESAAPESEGLL